MKKVYQSICTAEAYLAKTTLVVMVGMVFVAAVSRTMGSPIIWAVDVATFLFAWCVFFSADVAMRNNKLVKIEVFTKLLPQKFQKWVELLNHVLILVFLVVLIGFGTWLSYTTRLRTFQGIPSVSYTWVTISVPLGCTLMTITTILNIKKLLGKAVQEEVSSTAVKE